LYVPLAEGVVHTLLKFPVLGLLFEYNSTLTPLGCNTYNPPLAIPVLSEAVAAMVTLLLFKGDTGLVDIMTQTGAVVSLAGGAEQCKSQVLDPPQLTVKGPVDESHTAPHLALLPHSLLAAHAYLLGET